MGYLLLSISALIICSCATVRWEPKSVCGSCDATNTEVISTFLQAVQKEGFIVKISDATSGFARAETPEVNSGRMLIWQISKVDTGFALTYQFTSTAGVNVWYTDKDVDSTVGAYWNVRKEVERVCKHKFYVAPTMTGANQ